MMKQTRCKMTYCTVVLIGVAVLVLTLGAVNASDTTSDVPLHNNVTESNLTAEQLAYNAIVLAETDIQDMDRLRLGTIRVNDLLTEAWDAFNGENISILIQRAEHLNRTGQERSAQELASLIKSAQEGGLKIGENYTTVIEKTSLIRQYKLQALDLLDSITFLDLEIKELEKNEDVNLTEVLSLYGQTREAFGYERYTETGSLVQATQAKVEETKITHSTLMAVLKASQRNVVYFVRTNWNELLVSFFVLVLVGFIAYNEFMVRRYVKKIDSLNDELKALDHLSKKAQRDYYRDGVIAASDFRTKMGKYADLVSSIKRELPVVDERLKKKHRIRSVYTLGLTRHSHKSWSPKKL